ncbi:Intermediate transcription factor (VITF-3s) [Eptesipox virus]|uniref:Intermediate transcription factor 3 small subunit n=1 Tax=Eptesipox virus TaxID=1329402 RepID=A0A220T6G9_9POXV|nr:Intermediate transcription factor (VITF-3s) [Eptesipox virus]ASK51305.1 Intermediate transcription factor (VITF-3s) [Eptesipox virus]WAH71063.1 intermediate transcription factor VITF-3s [Eptesipox virus]
MFEPVPDLNLEANVELGEINVDKTVARVGETTNYVSKSRRLFTHKTKDDERKLALRFFLPRLYYLKYNEVNYLFRCIDTVKDVVITKKNNITSVLYVVLLTMASKGYKLSESMIEMFFPELFNEKSKKFKFVSQMMSIQQKIGYTDMGNYHNYMFEQYYATIALTLRFDEYSEIFCTRKECQFISSFTEITYRLYLLFLKSDIIQWSSATGAIINQLINTVLITIYDYINKSIKEKKIFDCTLAKENKLPIQFLLERKELLDRFIIDLKNTSSCKISKRDKDILDTYCIFY